MTRMLARTHFPGSLNEHTGPTSSGSPRRRTVAAHRHHPLAVALSGFVLTTPIRLDVVQQVHMKSRFLTVTSESIAKNKRQPYAVSKKAGHQTSAESWSTGRAVACISRVGVSGTQCSGQAAFGNMCRGGRTRTSTALPSSPRSPPPRSPRGHRIEQIEEVPLAVAAAAESLTKAVALLTALGAYADMQKVSSSRKLRAGRGKLRNDHHRHRRGFLVVYSVDNGIVKAFRSVELVNVTRLNILQLAPGGHIRCFVIWTRERVCSPRRGLGTFGTVAVQKKDYFFSTAKIANPDITCLINSSEIQAIVRPEGAKIHKRPWTQHKNPLTNKLVLFRLNPYAKTTARDGVRARNNKKKRAARNCPPLLE
ncbi:60S ribosomal protein L4/L1/L2 [Phellopilus nigrolimitatus]|nr:60S ribosomal protein L4/L1/L2 [Phellopilus nigrolimitatus]